MEGEISPKDRWSKIILIIAMVLIAGVVVVSILRDRIVNQPQWQVSVIGQGKVSYQPDIANVSLGVQIDKVAKADEALNQLNDKVAKIVAAVKSAGIVADDIQTQNYSLYPQYDYVNNSTNLSGYNANQQLSIKVRDINNGQELLSKVIAEATKAGANQVLGISFNVSNLEELKNQARIKAITEARQQAGTLAQATGVRLGRVVGWWENVVQAPGISSGVTYDGKGGMGGNVSASPTVPTGSQEIVIEINLNYRVR